MLCKNCGHEIYQATEKSWYHKNEDGSIWTTCECGCKKPEPEEANGEENK